MVLLLLSFVGGVVGTAVFGARADLGDLQRDVSIEGAEDRLVPGRIPFEVLERMDGESGGEMTVAIAVSSTTSSELECSFEDADGADVGWSDSAFDEQLLDTRYRDYDVLGTARLAPGSYEAICEVAGEPSEAAGVNFTVGRTVGVQDVSAMLGPLLGIVAVVVVAGLMFVVGLILLIVGLVQRSRARKVPPAGPYPPGQYPPGTYPPAGPFPGGQYPGGPPPPGQYPGGQYPGAQHPGSPYPAGHHPPAPYPVDPSAPGPWTPDQGSYPPAQPPPDGPTPQGSPGQVAWGDPPSVPGPGQPPAVPTADRGPSDGSAPWTGAPPEAPPGAPEPDRTPDPGASGWTIPPSKQQ